MRTRIFTLAAVVTGGLFVAVAPTVPTYAAGTCVGTAPTVCTFSAIGADSFIVPAGVTTVEVNATGSGGGAGGSFGPANPPANTVFSQAGNGGQSGNGRGGNGQIVLSYTGPAPIAQTLVKCGPPPAVPRGVKRNGLTVLTKAGCRTNAGQPVRVSVSASQRGDLRLYKLIKKANGKVMIRIYGYSLKLAITWRANATDTFADYKKVRSYRT